MKIKTRELTTNQILEEEIYKKQISHSHGILGKDVVNKYDTGKEIK